MSTDLTTAADNQQILTREQLELLKRTVCQDSTDDEFLLFTNVCKKSGLDPFTRQIHAVKRWDSNARREIMAIQTGIDGYRLIADRTGLYAGNDDARFDSEDGEHPGRATVTVYKLVAGQRVPFTATARWSEYAAFKKDGDLNHFWKRMPFLMLAKCAEALALRKAFPQELSGIYTSDEMQQADATPPAEPNPKTTSLQILTEFRPRIETAATDAELDAIGHDIKTLNGKLTKPDAQQLRELWKTRRAALAQKPGMDPFASSDFLPRAAAITGPEHYDAYSALVEEFQRTISRIPADQAEAIAKAIDQAQARIAGVPAGQEATK